MLHASTQTLILKLCELTARGDIAWREDASVLTFLTEGYVVELAESPLRLRLLHEDGRELERAESADLAAVSRDGVAFADRVTQMIAEARRHSRGTERAIAQILTSLSAPPKAEPQPVYSTRGGPESEAAMAAAVADMAARLSAPVPKPAAPKIEPIAKPDPPEWKPPVPPTERPAAPLKTVSTHAMFGAIDSFVRPMRNGHLRSEKSEMKVTSAGLVVPKGLIAPSAVTPEPVAKQAPPRTPQKAASADGYRPWS